MFQGLVSHCYISSVLRWTNKVSGLPDFWDQEKERKKKLPNNLIWFVWNKASVIAMYEL